jgi:predicted secreted protein
VSFAAVAEDTPFMHLFGYSASGRYMAFQQTYLFKQGLDIGSDT